MKTQYTKEPPPGYDLLVPSEDDVWRDGDLWLSWEGSWEAVREFVGRPIMGVGARIAKTGKEKP
jgi:hypothetical protein